MTTFLRLWHWYWPAAYAARNNLNVLFWFTAVTVTLAIGLGIWATKNGYDDLNENAPIVLGSMAFICVVMLGFVLTMCWPYLALLLLPMPGVALGLLIVWLTRERS